MFADTSYNATFQSNPTLKFINKIRLSILLCAYWFSDWADNVALLKPSEQSTTYTYFQAHRAVDNDLNTCSVTNGSANDWWQVDLGQHHHIQDITIITIGKYVHQFIAGLLTLIILFFLTLWRPSLPKLPVHIFKPTLSWLQF